MIIAESGQIGRDSPYPSRSTVLKYRLMYAQRGIRTSPADTARKKPHLKGWQHKATTSPQQITAESNRWPQAGILTPTGAEYGRWVLDEDAPGEIARLEDELGVPLWGTSTEVRTQSGNSQIHFLWTEGAEIPNSVGKNVGDGFEGLDVRGKGGLVLLPPSAGYDFANRLPMAEAPPELVEWASDRKREAKKPAEARSGRIIAIDPAKASLGGGLAALLEGPPIPYGQRFETMRSIGGHLNDGTRTDAQFMEDFEAINAARCEPRFGDHPTDRPDELELLGSWIFSKRPCNPVREANPELEELLGTLSAHWFASRLRGGGRSKRRDVARVVAGSVALHAEMRTVEVDGREARVAVFSDSLRQIGELCHAGHNAVKRAMDSFIEEGQIAILDEGEEGQSRTYGVVVEALDGALTDAAEREAAHKWYTPESTSLSLKKREVEGGVPVMRVEALRSPMWSWRSPVGNSGGGVLVALEAYGPMTSEELAKRLGISRARDLERRQLAKLEAMGLAERNGDTWALPADHAELAEAHRHQPYTTISRRRVRQKTREGRTVVHVEESERFASEVERLEDLKSKHSEDRRRFAERRRMAELAGVEGDEEVRALLNSWDEEREQVVLRDVSNLVELVESVEVEGEGNRTAPPSPLEAPSEPSLSPLAEAVRAYLDKNPHKSGETRSWLANTLWAYELVEGKPDMYAVATALGELERHGLYRRKEAA